MSSRIAMGAPRSCDDDRRLHRRAWLGALRHYGIYVFDFGAPIGFRHALAHPERITGVISQNGNVYEEGLGESFWKPVRASWKDPSDANRALLRGRIGFEGIKSLYLMGVWDPLSIPPENYWPDSALAARPGITEIQVDLKIDYETNIQLYPSSESSSASLRSTRQSSRGRAPDRDRALRAGNPPQRHCRRDPRLVACQVTGPESIGAGIHVRAVNTVHRSW
jgi:hypothetical protein